jgi:hypothetical protein
VSVQTEPNAGSIFWSLPIELRVRIYEFVFQYPASGLRYDSHPYFVPGDVGKLFTVTGDLKSPPNFDDWESSFKGSTASLVTDRVSSILAPFLVNKQFYQEAIPVLYNINTSFFEDPWYVSEFLQAMPAKHLQHVRTVGLDSGYSDESFRTGEEHILDTVEMQNERKLNLRNLMVRLPEELWAQDEHAPRTLEPPDGWKPGDDTWPLEDDEIPEIPGVETLGSMRGLTPIRVVDGPKIEAYLKARALASRPKQKKGKSKASSATKKNGGQGRKAKVEGHTRRDGGWRSLRSR